MARPPNLGKLIISNPLGHLTMTANDDVTVFLAAIERGEDSAVEKLLPIVYAELRMLARQQMTNERPDHTLQATALVHEAYMRLIGGQELSWSNRRHFFQSAVEAMRRILIEHARRRGRQKRGGGRREIPLDAVELAVRGDSEDLLSLDDAIRRLEKEDSRAAEIVRLRFFAGLDIEETAMLLGVSARTVKRDWTFARAWLHGALKEETGQSKQSEP